MSKLIHKRESIRFTPDKNTLIWIGTGFIGEEFSPLKVGLAINESVKGACMLTISRENDVSIEVGQEYLIKVGDLAPLKGKIVWKQNLGEGIFKIGIAYPNFK